MSSRSSGRGSRRFPRPNGSTGDGVNKAHSFLVFSLPPDRLRSLLEPSQAESYLAVSVSSIHTRSHCSPFPLISPPAVDEERIEEIYRRPSVLCIASFRIRPRRLHRSFFVNLSTSLKRLSVSLIASSTAFESVYFAHTCTSIRVVVSVKGSNGIDLLGVER